jgi:DDE superfamily endonuclease
VKQGDINSTAHTFDIIPSTLRSAWSKLRKVLVSHSINSNDREVLRALHLAEARGATTRRLLTDDEEVIVINKLRQRYPRGFNNTIIIKICHESFYALRDRPRLYSKHFLARFKRRANIRRSTLRVHQRTQADLEATFDEDVTKACLYLDKVHKLALDISPHLIINVDECPSYVRNLPTHALHFSDSPAPYVWVRAKERDAVTVIGAVTGVGRVLDTAVVAKGTTTRCEAKFRAELPRSFIQHTASGITTSESFVEYMEHVIVPYTNNQPSMLIADAYKAHFTSQVKVFCKTHNIRLVVVPDRATSVLQPLDVAVFGLAKLNIYRDVSNMTFEIDRDEASRWEATAECVKAINHVSVAGGLRGWKETFPFWPEVMKAHKLE